MEGHPWPSADDDEGKGCLDGFFTDHPDISMRARDAFMSGH